MMVGIPTLADTLENLARPSLGHWWEFMRTLLPILGLAQGSITPLPDPPSGPPPRPWRRWLALAAGALVVGCLLAAYLWPRECTLERGEALARQGRYKEALQCFEAIIAREPSTSQQAFRGRAEALRKIGDDNPHRALKLYDEALESEKVPHYPEAIRKYWQASQLDPAFFWAANKVAYLFATCPDSDLQNPAEAVRLAENACRRSGWKCWQTLDTLAVALAAEKEFDKAVEVVDQALQLAPENEKALLSEKQQNYRNRQPWKPKTASNGEQ
jgi:tetratricopeptide (TPR) repeat protein